MKKIISFITTLLFITACSQENSKPLNYPELTNDGVNSINDKTPYETRYILPKILGFEIDELTSFVRGKPLNIMRVNYKGKEAMIIVPTQTDEYSKRYIKEIAITSNYIKNPFKLKIGDNLDKKLFSKCQELNKDIICKKDNYSNIKAIFANNSDKNYTLKELVWSISD